MKKKLFKLLFPFKAKLLKETTESWHENGRKRLQAEEEVRRLEEKLVFFLPIDFSNVDEKAKPPHPLKGLDNTARKNALARLESIYSDDWYKKMRDYIINVLGNQSFQVEKDETKMYRGRYMALGIKALNTEFEDAHNEFIGTKKKEEDFDPLDILPG